MPLSICFKYIKLAKNFGQELDMRGDGSWITAAGSVIIRLGLFVSIPFLGSFTATAIGALFEIFHKLERHRPVASDGWPIFAMNIDWLFWVLIWSLGPFILGFALTLPLNIYLIILYSKNKIALRYYFLVISIPCFLIAMQSLLSTIKRDSVYF